MQQPAMQPPAEERLRVLQRLLDQRLISEDEFRSRRADILNGL